MNILTITLNPAFDVTLWVRDIDFEEPVKAEKEVVFPGSKGVNVSRVLTSLGVGVTALGIAGQENYGTFHSLLEREGVQANFITCDGSIRQNMTICTKGGKVLKINRTGEPVPEMAMDALKILIRSHIKNDTENLLVFAGSIPPNITKEECKIFLMELQRDSCVRIALDTDLFRYEDLLEIQPFIIKPNALEFAKMFGQQAMNMDEVRSKTPLLDDAVEHILISLGSEGLYYRYQQAAWRASVPGVDVKSTIGAGDTTLAGFIRCLGMKKSTEYVLRYAAACGTAAVMMEGTGIIAKAMAEEIFQKTTIWRDNGN